MDDTFSIETTGKKSSTGTGVGFGVGLNVGLLVLSTDVKLPSESAGVPSFVSRVTGNSKTSFYESIIVNYSSEVEHTNQRTMRSLTMIFLKFIRLSKPYKKRSVSMEYELVQGSS